MNGIRGWLVLGLVLTCGSVARADLLYAGVIEASFSNPVLAGSYLDVGHQPVYQDNTTSAYYSITNNGSSATLISGDNNGGASSPSILTFTGSAFTAAPGQPFTLGTLTYFNGTSSLTSVIYGATLTLSVPGRPDITPATVAFSLTTTANGGVDAFLDADYLTFPAPVGLNFHVYENAGATATMSGAIIGDPQLVFNGLQLGSGQAGVLTPVSPVPAPAGMALLGVGAVCLLANRWRRGA